MDLEPGGPLAAGVITAHQAGAALLTANTLCARGRCSRQEAADAYARTATNAVYSTRDLGAGQAILERAGLVVEVDGLLQVVGEIDQLLALSAEQARETLAGRYLTLADPLWLAAAAGEDHVAWELVPEHEAQALAGLFVDLAEREAFLLAAARRVDPDRDARTGRLAEEHVVAACRAQLGHAGRADLAERVRQVSLTSDQLGYDVTAPRLDDSSRRLEVKGTRTQGSTFTVTVSRNEARQAARDADWFLVACRVAADDTTTLNGWLAGAQLEAFLPEDPVERGQWRSVDIELDESMLTAGLPSC